MKGIYILCAILLLLAVLVYLAVKPTDSDLRRSYNQLASAMETLEKKLADQEELLVFLRKQKRRTAKLDKEFDARRQMAGEMRMKLNAALHNVENLSGEIRKTTEHVLESLNKEMQQQLAGAVSFEARVRTLHDFVKESFPLHRRMEELQTQMNALVEKRQGDGLALSPEQLADVDGFNFRCGQIQSWMKDVLTTVHTDREQGEILAQTTVNELKKLLPSLEAFVEDLGAR